MEERDLHIGDVAALVGLSIRTLRHYDELGVASPSARTPAGYRLYNTTDVELLRFVKGLKPLGFSLEEIQELVALRRRFHNGDRAKSVVEQLRSFALTAQEQRTRMTEQLAAAEHVADELATIVNSLATISRKGRTAPASAGSVG